MLDGLLVGPIEGPCKYIVIRYMRRLRHQFGHSMPTYPHPDVPPAARDKRHLSSHTIGVDRLRDFSTDWRLLILAAMAPVVGTAGALAAWALLHLIYLFTNLSYYGVFSAAPVSIVGNRLGMWSALISVAGCFVIGLMARFGSEKIRGHGIPEAMEAILIGRSRIEAEGRRAQAALIRHLHRHRRAVRRRRPDHHDRRRLRLAVRAVLQPVAMPSARRCWSPAPPPAWRRSSARRWRRCCWRSSCCCSSGSRAASCRWRSRRVVAAAWRPWLLQARRRSFPCRTARRYCRWDSWLAAALGVIAGLGSGLLTQMVYAQRRLVSAGCRCTGCGGRSLGGIAVGLGGLIEPHALGVGYDNIAALLQRQHAPRRRSCAC